MGLDYSYVLVIELSAKEQLLDSIRRSGTIIREPGPIEAYVTLDFALDDALLAYWRDEAERPAGSLGWSRSSDKSHFRNYFPTDDTARVGYIDLESKLDSASGQLYVSFTAVTTRMSRLFQQSGSIQNWFVELGSSLRAMAVFLHQEAEGYRFVQLRGHTVSVELPEVLDEVLPSAFDESLALSVGRGYDRLFLI